ncbi:TonB-dependent receptor [Labilibacter marinus]|uniref:TonB-dependent receptor n=1 Tax=Labilibacter marinus TaxID=1477105 RepID=UPI00094F82CD|nr:TonB-dependent receptor [Labilibacter marinus]
MKNVFLLLLMLLSTEMFGQHRVSGKITDKHGDPLPGASVIIKGTTIGEISDFNGNYSITVSGSEVMLVYSFIGFTDQEISASGKTQINIELVDAMESLGEVKVRGFAGVVGKARKRTESVQKTPESVTALNADGIENAGITDINTFSNLVPNLKFNTAQAVGFNFITVRGIPQVRGGDAPLAFVVDGVTIPDPSLLSQELYDLALIEVVKGPQGALYGKNAIGGAINVYSKDPTNTMKNKVQLGYGNGNAKQAQFISSGAIKEDKVFYRFSSQYKESDGLLTNEFLNKKVDFNKDINLRGQIKANITDNFTLSATYQHFNIEGGAAYYSVNPTGFEGFPGGSLNPNPKKGNNVIVADELGRSDMINNYGNVKMDYVFGNVKLQSITSYNKVDKSMFGDLDFLDIPLFTQSEETNTSIFNQEFRFSNTNSDARLDWSAGTFYQITKEDFYAWGTEYDEVEDEVYEYMVADITNETRTMAIFGFVDYQLTEKLTASAGFRYDMDKFSQDDYLFMTAPSRNNNEFQPKVSISYQAAPSALLYANYGRGYRTGGFNPEATDLFNRDFEDEITDNYEFGFKTTSWDNRFIFNGSAFYTDFRNQQQYILDLNTFLSGIYNYEKSTIVGFELESRIRITNYLDVFANYGLTNAKIVEGGKAGGENGDETDNTQYNGNKTPFVPVDNFTVGLESSFDITSDIKFNGFVNLDRTGKTYWHESNQTKHTSDAYSLLSAKLGFAYKNWDLNLWGKNLTDTQYYQEFSPGEYVGSPDDVAWRGQPLSFGTSVSVKF